MPRADRRPACQELAPPRQGLSSPALMNGGAGHVKAPAGRVPAAWPRPRAGRLRAELPLSQAAPVTGRRKKTCRGMGYPALVQASAPCCYRVRAFHALSQACQAVAFPLHNRRGHFISGRNGQHRDLSLMLIKPAADIPAFRNYAAVGLCAPPRVPRRRCGAGTEQPGAAGGTGGTPTGGQSPLERRGGTNRSQGHHQLQQLL